jgi:hypothetical protein
MRLRDEPPTGLLEPLSVLTPPLTIADKMIDRQSPALH